MKSKYSKPKIAVLLFGTEDVLTASDDNMIEGGWNDWENWFGGVG